MKMKRKGKKIHKSEPFYENFYIHLNIVPDKRRESRG